MAYCELCNHTVVRGIVHRINGYTVCHDCRNDLVASYGEEVDNTAAAQQLHQADADPWQTIENE